MEFVHDLFDISECCACKKHKNLDTPTVSRHPCYDSKTLRHRTAVVKIMDSNHLADSIAEELLQLTGAALLSRDFHTFKSHFALPLRLETVEGHRFLTTDAEFFEVFEAVLTHLDETEVSDFVRTVIFADFVSEDIISSVHVCSEIHADGELRRSAYPVHSTLVLTGSDWKIVSCLYVILDNTNHNRALVKASSVVLSDA